MGKIDLTYINKQMAAKKAAKAEVKEVKEMKEVVEEKEELFGETYEEFHNRLESEMEEARKAIRAIREMGF